MPAWPHGWNCTASSLIVLKHDQEAHGTLDAPDGCRYGRTESNMNRRLWTTLLVLCWCLPLVAAQTEVLGVFPKGAAPMLYLKKANKHRLRNRRKGRE